MPSSPEKPRKEPKMAQGKKAGEPPPDDAQDRFNKVINLNNKLQLEKILEIINRQKKED